MEELEHSDGTFCSRLHDLSRCVDHYAPLEIVESETKIPCHKCSTYFMHVPNLVFIVDIIPSILE
jgi:hypothetical protein